MTPEAAPRSDPQTIDELIAALVRSREPLIDELIAEVVRSRASSSTFDPAAEIVAPKHLPLVVGLAEITCWRLRKRGLFPEPIKLCAGRIGWRRSVLDAWLAERQAASK